MEIIAEGLRFPEGPVYMPDGSIIVCEIEAGRVTQISQDGSKTVLASTGGGPNGAARGQDGRIYICNSGGFEFAEQDGLLLAGDHPADHAGGSIQVIDIDRGTCETLYTACGDLPLNSPNDLVIDAQGGIYFTDFGRSIGRQRDHGAVFYAKPDGSHIQEVAFPLITPNGIGLSPDQTHLIVVESYTGRLWQFDIIEPGVIAPRSPINPGTLLYNHSGWRVFDSLAVQANGAICIGSGVEGGVTIIDPTTQTSELVSLPDIIATNLCFGGQDMKDAYICLSSTGRLVKMQWAEPGLVLNG